MTAKDIEVALCAYPSSLFYCRRWVVVPRVSWGLESHECDILALSSSNYAHEIEIKISISDLKADFKKHHQHISRDNKIKCLWYAAPVEMQAAMDEATLGPWENDRDTVNASHGLLAIMLHDGRSDNRVNANAQIMAAAPDALAWIKEALPWLASLRDALRGAEGGAHLDQFYALDALIARVKPAAEELCEKIRNEEREEAIDEN